jgi:hypothetical protein
MGIGQCAFHQLSEQVDQTRLELDYLSLYYFSHFGHLEIASISKNYQAEQNVLDTDG